MKKNKKFYVVYLFLILIFSLSLVNKTLQNDTFFYIPIGEYIAKTHTIDGIDHWSFHDNLRFTYPGWICDLIIYLLYNSFGFRGIYVLMLVITALISIVLFNTLLKGKNGLFLSFIITIFSIYSASGVFTARNQIFSFLVFLLECYCLNGLLERGKKKYFWILLILAFLLINVHDTLYPLFFVIALPYLAEIILKKFFKLENSDKLEYTNLSNEKYLIILLVLAIFIGFFTPVFGTAYTNLIFCMNGVSAKFIKELQPLNLLSNYTLTFLTFLTLGIICFTKTKIKIKDLLFTLGFILFSLIAIRNLYFMYLIGIIYFTNIITSFLNTYIGEENKERIFQKFENSKIFIISAFCIILTFSVYKFSTQWKKEYVDTSIYPTLATKWIKNNLDYENIRIWNSFDWGSYLELNGIKVFVDSRSGMYTEQENKGCTVLEDWYSVIYGEESYETVFEKYDITHVIVENKEIISKYIWNDENYKMIYNDGNFSIYEKIT